MKRIGLTLTTTLILSVALYIIVAFWFALGAESARAIAGIPLLCAAQFLELADRHRVRADLASDSAARVATFHEFGVKWPWAIIIGLFATLGLYEIIIFYMVGYLLIGKIGIDHIFWNTISDPDLSDLDYAFSIMGATVPIVIGLYLIGRWLGARSRSNVVISLGGIATALAISKLFIISTTIPDDFKADLIRIITFQTLVYFVVCLGASAVGFWRGRNRRLAEYIGYLLSVLPAASRAALLSLAEDEAQRQP